MRKISSNLTFFVKYVNPVCVLVVLWIFGKSINEKMHQGQLPSYSLGIFVLIGILFLLLLRRIYANLVDDVYEQTDGILIRKRAMKIEIKYSEIKDLELCRYNPPLIKVHLHSPCKFGNVLSFVPTTRIFSFMDVPLYHELKRKVDEASLTDVGS